MLSETGKSNRTNASETAIEDGLFDSNRNILENI